MTRTTRIITRSQSAVTSSSTSGNQIPQPNSTETARSKRERKPKNSTNQNVGTAIRPREATLSINQPSNEVKAMGVESSQSIVTGPERGRKTKNTTVGITRPTNVATNANTNVATNSNTINVANTFNKAATLKRGHRRKAVSEDNITADQPTNENPDASGETFNPPKRERKKKQESTEVSVTTTAEASTYNNCGIKRKDNIGEAEEQGKGQQNKKQKTKKTENKKPKKPKEERQAKTRLVCPSAIRDRIHRAESQRIYMVSRNAIDETKQEFVVLGSTGNVYTVTISHIPNCTCPDFLKGNLCKHIIFVYLRVLRLNKNSTYIYQKALLTEELQFMFSNAAPDPSALANKRVRETYKEFTSGEVSKSSDEKRRPIEGDCPICYEPLEEKDRANIVWCQGCGNNLHSDCFEQWKKSKRGGPVTCVYCRVGWAEEHSAETVINEGYVNLGNVQGMSTMRDTSTYYGPSRYRRGSWF